MLTLAHHEVGPWWLALPLLPFAWTWLCVVASTYATRTESHDGPLAGGR